MSSGQPSVSLHITNLNHQIPKAGKPHSASPVAPAALPAPIDRSPPSTLAEIRRALYGLCSLYGKVLDVVHTRSARVRGTAFVVFRDLASSTQALRALDGEIFYARQLVSSRAHLIRMYHLSRQGETSASISLFRLPDERPIVPPLPNSDPPPHPAASR